MELNVWRCDERVRLIISLWMTICLASIFWVTKLFFLIVEWLKRWTYCMRSNENVSENKCKQFLAILTFLQISQKQSFLISEIFVPSDRTNMRDFPCLWPILQQKSIELLCFRRAPKYFVALRFVCVKKFHAAEICHKTDWTAQSYCLFKTVL